MDEASQSALQEIESGYKYWCEYVELMRRAGDPVPPNISLTYGYTDILLAGITQLRVAIARALDLDVHVVNVVMQPNLKGVLAITGVDVAPPEGWKADIDEEMRKDMVQTMTERFFSMARELVSLRLSSYMRIRRELLPVSVVESADGPAA